MNGCFVLLCFSMDVMVMYWEVCMTIWSDNKDDWRCVSGSFGGAGSGYGILGLGYLLVCGYEFINHEKLGWCFSWLGEMGEDCLLVFMGNAYIMLVWFVWGCISTLIGLRR